MVHRFVLLVIYNMQAELIRLAKIQQRVGDKHKVVSIKSDGIPFISFAYAKTKIKK